jgi:hypothetical protein
LFGGNFDSADFSPFTSYLPRPYAKNAALACKLATPRYEKEKHMSQENQLAANHNARPLPARVNIQVSHMRKENVNSRFAASMEHGAKQRGGAHWLSRRRFIASAGILTAAAWLSPRHLLAEGENIVVAARKRAETTDITVQALRGNVSALIGSGGNIAVLTGRDGKLIIDSGYATSRARITDALAKIDPGVINHLVNTHWHFDHTDGNEWMHSDGATILAHENTRKHLSTTTRVEGWDFTFPPSPAGAIPTEIFDRKKPCTLIVPLSRSPTTGPATLTATYRPILLRLRSFTPAIPGGTVITRSSIIPPEAISRA